MASRGRARSTATDRGRARGELGEVVRGARSTSSGGPARPPNPDTLLRIGVLEEKDAEREVERGQFDDAESAEDVKSHGAPIEGNQCNIETAPSITPPTSCAGSNSSFNPNTPELSPPSSSLNPSAPIFSPTGPLSPASRTKLNPTTPEFSPVNGTSNNINPVNTSHSNTRNSPETVAHMKLSVLNPNSSEFFPQRSSPSKYSVSSLNSSLNVSAPAFVPNDIPTGMQNGQLCDENEEPIPSVSAAEEGIVDEEPLMLKPNDVISGVQYPFDETSDVASESLLKAAAEVLIKLTLYPASFERGKTKLENTVKSWAPTENAVANLAELLIHWGINEPSLRLSSSRICQVLNEMELLRGVFNRQLVVRLRHWFGGRTMTKKDRRVNFALFFAEIFSRLRTSNQEAPVNVLGDAVRTLLTELLEESNEKEIIGACHILKLTGSLLAGIPEGETRMDNIVATLERLSTDETLNLSDKCVEIMVRVLELQARQWRNHAQPLTSVATTNPPALNQHMFESDDMVPVPLEGDGTGEGGLVPSQAEFQVPISNPEDWNEFLDEDNQPIEDSHITQSYVMAGESGQNDDELDAEIQEEFEFFVQDLEEHLLNVGEMDPEQFQEEQQQ